MTPRTWLPDPSHYPEQMTPLSATVWFEALGHGLHEAMRILRGPFAGFEARTELGWAYEGERELEWEPDPDRIRAAALELPERWQADFRPRVHEITREIEHMRPDRVPAGDAADLLDRLWELVLEQWTIHFLVVIPAQIAAEILHDRYKELFGDDDPLAPYRLLEGISSTADATLTRLAGCARQLAVDDLIRDFATPHALVRLRESAQGRRFLHELDAYLLEYGGRVRWHELSLPREAELPVLTFESLRLLLEGAEPLDREAPDPPAELSDLVAQVREAYALKELHTYDIDYPGLLAVRTALLGFGRRLYAEGALEEVEDVWMLTRGELASVLHDDLPLRPIVEQRRRELHQGLAEGPKHYLGEAPAPQQPRHAVLEKFYGTPGTSLTGAAASPGVAEGIARVVTGPEDFRRVEAGDVLIAATTTPAWTPLFATLAALVTDTGGVLSHAAVVAREYGLPAVVGAAGATTAIPDGARVRVDGGAGVVAIVST